MFNVKNPSLELEWKGELTEYITDLSWSKNGDLAVCSASGEVMVWSNEAQLILPPNDKEESINNVVFSGDGQFLAAGGQDGQVRIWQLPPLKLIHTLNCGSQWLDHLSWHPHQNYLAFNQGRYVQIWELISGEIIATLPFENSSVLSLAWNSTGELLAIAGNGGVKVWENGHWDDDPCYLEMASAATKITWSKDGKYIAASCIDDTVLIWPWQGSSPWRLSGFSGKIRNLAWSDILSGIAPLLAVSCRGNIIIWKKAKSKGWKSHVLGLNENLIQALQFQPETLHLATCGEDGYLSFWENAKKLSQNLTGIKGGFSCLKWSYQGDKLSIGGDYGEILIFSQSQRGQGFG
jgi:WD40 repeat protein